MLNIKNYTVQMLNQNFEPFVEITLPDSDLEVEAGENIEISWSAEDKDDNAEVTLFYDEDREGANGNTITSGLLEDDIKHTFIWNTDRIAPGRYYVYAKIDDGKNFPVFSYSTASVTIKRTDFPPPVFKAVAQGPEGLSLSWDAVAGADGYRIYYKSVQENIPLEEGKAIAVWGVTEAALHNLDWGKSYQLAVSAFTEKGDQSGLSESFEITMNNLYGNNSPEIVSKPITVAQAGTTYTYQIDAVDEDNDLLSYHIISGPAGLNISPLGKITWSIGDDDAGSHTIKVSASDSDNASAVQQFDLQVLSTQQKISEPFADIAYSANSGQAPLTVSFQAITFDTSGEKLSYLWDFGDGQNSTDLNVTHDFIQKGTYTVILKISTESGASASKTLIVYATDKLSVVEPPDVTEDITGSRVSLSWNSSEDANGCRFYIGNDAMDIDYEKPVDVGNSDSIVFTAVPAGRYVAVFRSYLAETGETWDSKKVILRVGQLQSENDSNLKGAIEGIVFDNSTRAPVSGATVRFIFYETTTDNDGKFRFESLPALKKAYVTASKDGYSETSLPLYIEDGKSSACTIKLTPGSENNNECPAERLAPEMADILRLYRNTELAGNEKGRALIKQYYKCAPEIQRILEGDPDIKNSAKELLQNALPWIKESIMNKNTPVPELLKKKAEKAIENFKAKSSERLKEFLNVIEDMYL
jgi:PKD repeat protein